MPVADPAAAGCFFWILHSMLSTTPLSMPSDSTRLIVVNLFGGPGIGKSTARAGVFCRMKQLGHSVEEVHEYAKELVWDGDLARLADQKAVFAEQHKRQRRLAGKVQVAITDSPLLLSCVYAPRNYFAEFPAMVAEAVATFDNIDILLERAPGYETVGRIHDEAQAIAKDGEIKRLLDEGGRPYITVPVGDSTVDSIVAHIQRQLAAR